jgi:ABC-2 type transport system permease protein
MKLVIAYFKAETLQLVRVPFFVVATLLLPGLLFSFFGIPYAQQSQNAALPMASFTVYAVLSVAMFQFGVHISDDRISPWEVFLRTLPVSPLTRFTARILSALLFAAAASAVVIILGLGFTPARLSFSEWLAFVLAVLLGSIPFVLFGIAIGYWLTPKAAAPVAEIVSLVMAFAGGLWVGLQSLPTIVATISPHLPTRMYGELAWRAVLGQSWAIGPWIGLLTYTLIFGTLAVWGYKRDEGRRYK